MEFKKIKEMWAEDSEIDFTKIADVSLGSAKLHAKYMNILVEERYKLRQLYEKLNTTKVEKRDYYLGLCTADVYKKNPLKVNGGMKVIKGEVKHYVDGDPEVSHLNLVIGAMEEKVFYLEEILKSIMNRHWEIKHYIDWAKFKSGVN